MRGTGLRNDLCDEDLVALAQRGDQEALESLVDRYQQEIEWLSSAFFSRQHEREDLLQEGVLGLLGAVRNYAPTRSPASFRVFARLCVRRQLITAIKQANRAKHGPLSNAVSLQQPAFDDDDGPMWEEVIVQQGMPEPLDQIISRDRTVELLGHIRRTLTPYEKAVLKLWLDDLPFHEIAARLGKRERDVANTLDRARLKLSGSADNRRHELASAISPNQSGGETVAYIFTVGCVRIGPARVPSRTTFEVYCRKRFWDLPERAPRVAEIAAGSRVVFYLAGPGESCFVADAECSDAPYRIPPGQEVRVQGAPIPCMKWRVHFRHILKWSSPRNMADLVDQVDFVPSHLSKYYGLYFRQSVRAVTSEDYQRISGSARA